jgi:hypothetical protein
MAWTNLSAVPILHLTSQTGHRDIRGEMMD